MKHSINENKQNQNKNRLEHLIASMGRGDVEGLEEFYQLTRASVFGLALSIVQNFHDAEDITHETYVKVFRSAGTYEAKGKPLAWIYTVTKNLSLMKIRDRKKSTRFPNDGDVDSHAYASAAAPARPVHASHSDDGPMNATDSSIEDRIVLLNFLHELTEEEQSIVVLHAVSGWKHKEIAAFLNLPVQNTIVKYGRAIKKLIRKYQQHALT